MAVDNVMRQIIDHGGLDFLIKGAEAIGRDRLLNKKAIPMAARAVVFYIEPDRAAMFGENSK